MPHFALNKSLALVLWGKDKKGQDDVAVYRGTLVERGGSLYFQYNNGEAMLELQEDWPTRVVEVPTDISDILLKCSYQLPLSVGDIGDSKDAFHNTGLRWPGQA
jgi:hypothetical protein